VRRRSLFVVLSALVAGLAGVLFSGTAWAVAPPYPAPPVTGSGAPGVLSTAVMPMADPGTGGLAYTGSGMNLTATVSIAAAILLLGVALVVLGVRMRSSARRG